jgi:lysine biosynthesis protein LysW
MAVTHCLSCDGEIHRDNPRLGVGIICTECGELLEVIETDPFEVDYPPDDFWDYGDDGREEDEQDEEDEEDEEDGEDEEDEEDGEDEEDKGW